MRHTVKLTDAEFAQLDGCCTDETQRHVDLACERVRIAETHGLTEPQASLVADLLVEARSTGVLLHQSKQIRYCVVCGKDAGYALYTRDSTSHWKGTPNHDKPLYLRGVEFAHRFVVMKGHAVLGCCRECAGTLVGALGIELLGVAVQLPEHWPGGRPCHWTRYPHVLCTACGWTGHEGEMRTIQGLHRRYPGGCPACEAENKPFRALIIEPAEGFTMVETTCKIAKP